MATDDITQLLRNLSISDSTISSLAKKPSFVQNVSQIAAASANFTRLHYSLACTAPKDVDVVYISELIDRGLIRHENMLRGLYFYFEKKSTEPVEEFIRAHDKSRDEIRSFILSCNESDRRSILREAKKAIPFADFKIVMEEIDAILPKEDPSASAKGRPSGVSSKHEEAGGKTKGRYCWLEEGEVSLLSRPEENRQTSPDVLRSHLERTGGRVVTRFPPEPNGNLHIGHVKAINLNFEYAAKHGGLTYLRFDDTNPRNEKSEYYQSILEDLEWLGFKPHKITASSDYNDFMNEKSIELIKKGKAYVCHCSVGEIRNRRFLFQKEREEGRFDASLLSPYRNRTVEENLAAFKRMLEGEYQEGKAVLRFKMDLESKNPMMLDLVGSRVIDAVHPGKGRNWHVYPSYEFALCVSDSLEDVTHSFCSREFQTRQESYHWLLRNLNLYEPIQWEFSRLNLSNTVLSKRKMNELVRRGIDWDDPRLYTVQGMRRRGFTPQAINRFVQSVGLTYSDSIVDVRILENFVREDLDRVATRAFCIQNPLKVTISNLQKKRVEMPMIGRAGENTNPLVIDLKKVIYIDEDDFDCDGREGFLRLTPGQPVGLIGLGTIRFIKKATDGIVCEICDEKPRKHIQWLADLNLKVTLRLYEPLFRSFNPEEEGYINDINWDSCKTVTAYCDLRVNDAKPLDKFQFVRRGFFCCDTSSKDSNLIFNLTLPLKTGY